MLLDNGMCDRIHPCSNFSYFWKRIIKKNTQKLYWKKKVQSQNIFCIIDIWKPFLIFPSAFLSLKLLRRNRKTFRQDIQTLENPSTAIKEQLFSEERLYPIIPFLFLIVRCYYCIYCARFQNILTVIELTLINIIITKREVAVE